MTSCSQHTDFYITNIVGVRPCSAYVAHGKPRRPALTFEPACPFSIRTIYVHAPPRVAALSFPGANRFEPSGKLGHPLKNTTAELAHTFLAPPRKFGFAYISRVCPLDHTDFNW